MDRLDTFSKSATSLSQSPLGIVALFIVMVYGLASLVMVFGSSLDALDRHVFVAFLTIFPIVVLAVFSWLVSRHYNKLFGPSNFKNEDKFNEFVNMQLTAVASLTAAASKDNAAPSQSQIRNIINVVGNAAKYAFASDIDQNCVLWVDDKPENNVLERRAFEAVGIKFTLALSTEEALTHIKKRKFEAIISDMGRKEGSRERYALLDRLRSEGDQTPFFIYVSSNTPEHKKETEAHKGQGCTNNVQDLFAMVMKTIILHR